MIKKAHVSNKSLLGKRKKIGHMKRGEITTYSIDEIDRYNLNSLSQGLLLRSQIFNQTNKV